MGYRETADGWIPWALFWWCYQRLPKVLAMERAQLTRATALGVGLVWNGEKVLSATQRDTEEAWSHHGAGDG